MSELLLSAEIDKNKVKIEMDKYSDQILISTNGWQYSGVMINKEVAEMTITLLKNYLNLKKENK